MMRRDEMRNVYWVGLWFVLLLCGCASHSQKPQPASRVARTSGSAVALSRDERVAVVCNRTQGSVTVFELSVQNGLTQARATRSIDTGADEPWAAVFGLDDDTAYVLFKNAQVVRKLTSVHTDPELQSDSVAVGSEPSSILITPSGQKLLVANWGEGTISVITTQDFTSPATIDLNPTLLAAVELGVPQSRLGLAHPRALAITDNGDDSDFDETLYATEFFSQTSPDQTDLAAIDRSREGFVYPISMKTGQPANAIPIAPRESTGFSDGTGAMTSCFPNQLYAAAVDRGLLYVTSMCASPKGPLGPNATAPDGSTTTTDANFKTLFHPAVFVIDTAINKELLDHASVLTQTLAAYYQAGEDATNERMPLIPNDIVFTNSGPNGAQAYLSASGADAIYRLDYDAAGQLKGVGDPGARYIDVQSSHGLPVGLALSQHSNPAFALVVTDAKLRLSVVDLASGRANSIDAYTDATAADVFRKSPLAQGKGFFGTGRDIWSFKGQAWSSCEGCHPGGLTDGLTWFFSRGPRRTISTANSYDKVSDVAERTRRMLLWGANIDEVHDIEAIVRSVSGGVGAALWSYADDANNDCRLIYDGSTPASSGNEPCFGQKNTSTLQNSLNGALSGLDSGADCVRANATCDHDSLPDWSMIDAFIRAERAPHAPTLCTPDPTGPCLDPNDISAGRQLFEQGRCAGCHGGPHWTVSRLFYQPGADLNGALPYSSSASSPTVGQLGKLRVGAYSVAQSLLPLNPAAAAGGGSAPFRNFQYDNDTQTIDDGVIKQLYAASTQADDQIQCALRAVGTFPLDSSNFGPRSPDANMVYEVRQDMHTAAQGASGFNVPSLFGLSLGAPYFHAGNAPSLEAALDSSVFAAHLRALAPDFLSSPDATLTNAQVRQLTTFLLSIDERTAQEPIPQTDTSGTPIAYDFCN